MLFGLSDCRTYETVEGEVINKKYEEAYSYTTVVFTGKAMMPVSHYMSEQYKIEILKQKNEEIKTRWVSISQEEYEKIEIGNWYKEE